LSQLALVVNPLTWTILEAIKRDFVEHVVIGVADVIDPRYRVEHNGKLLLLFGDDGLKRLFAVLSVGRFDADKGSR
jgi:hypothetical protein